MLEKFLKIVSPNSDSLFVYYILPALFSLAAVILIWILLLATARLLKIKVEIWKGHKYQGSFTRQLLVSQKSFLHKSLESIRYVLSFYILFLLASHTLEIFSTELKEPSVPILSQNEKIWTMIADYSHKSSLIFDKLSSVGMNIFLTILIAVWCIQILEKILNAFLHKATRFEQENSRSIAKKSTLNAATNQLLRVIISVIALFTILENLGINIAALLATAGLASVAIGFGAQSLVKDFIAGFFILFEDQFAVGDVVDIGTSVGLFSGGIEKMTLRMVRMRSSEGSLLTIPNGDIRAVKNYTTDWSQLEFKYSLEIKSNLEKASLIFKEEVERLSKDFPMEIISIPDIRTMDKIVDFENRSVATTFRVFMKIINIKTKIKLEMEFNKRLLARFKTEDVYLLK